MSRRERPRSVAFAKRIVEYLQQSMREVDEALHATAAADLERRIMELALERTGARHGAIFLWDAKRHGLVVDFHVVEGMVVPMPSALIQEEPDRPSGVAMH